VAIVKNGYGRVSGGFIAIWAGTGHRVRAV